MPASRDTPRERRRAAAKSQQDRTETGSLYGELISIFGGESATRYYIGQICLLLVRSFGMSQRLAS
jgi:hypothetical protein